MVEILQAYVNRLFVLKLQRVFIRIVTEHEVPREDMGPLPERWPRFRTPHRYLYVLKKLANSMCTSVCFGGDDLQDLYIVSGSDGLEGDKRGGVFKVRTEVAGLPVANARVKLPQ